MLTTLRIKNLALVADLTLDLAPGLNVLTGETGAGKSVVLGALNLVLGQRAERSLIRTGADACTVEALFDVSAGRSISPDFFEANGLETGEDGQLVIKRTFTAAGSNRQFVNGSPTQLSILAALGDGLVDLHGPHDHQSLLQPMRQLAILDAFGNLSPTSAKLGDQLRQRQALAAQRSALVVDERSYAQELDLRRFQVREIEEARLRIGEDEELEAEHRRVANAARLLADAQTALDLLGENEAAALIQLGAVGRALQDIQRLDPAGSGFLEAHAQLVGLTQELQRDLSRYAEQLAVDPVRLQEVEERLNLLQGLKRKYGHTLEEVLAFGVEAKAKLLAWENRDAEVARLDHALSELDQEIGRLGRELSQQRHAVLPRLSKAVARELAALGFPRSSFEVALTPLASVSASGLDHCEFQFAPNPGEPPRPLRAIGSSGELARVMLALKTVLAAEDEVPVLVFDEVDANVGGETAVAVGAKLRQIARQHQVLCITHLAPVAAAAEAHFVVSKALVNGRTESRVERLGPEERIEELARMLGGVTAAARKHAEELLQSSRRKSG